MTCRRKLVFELNESQSSPDINNMVLDVVGSSPLNHWARREGDIDSLLSEIHSSGVIDFRIIIAARCYGPVSVSCTALSRRPYIEQ